jgi:hypothetical protein
MKTESLPSAAYVFGPLERRGLIGGLRAGQLALITAGVVALIFCLSAGATALGLALSGVALALAFVPLRGHTADQWAPIAAAFWARRLSGEGRWRNDAALLGHQGDGQPPWPHLPSHLRGLAVVETPAPGGQPMGVIRHRSRYTAVLAVRPQSFALCDSEEQARRHSGWGAVLAGLAREGGPVSRVQWVERTAPADDGELARHAHATLTFPAEDPLAASYLQLVDDAGPATQAHEAFVAVQMDVKRAPRLVKAAGGAEEGAFAVLRRELATVWAALAAADVTVDGPLSPRALARTIRVAFDPGTRPALARRGALDPTLAGVAPGAAWPSATEDHWAAFRADDSWHATYWVEEWPRTPVRPDFLSPLLLGTRCARTVSLTAEPVPPGRAARQVEAARTADVADEELRRRAGFLSSARRRRQHEGVQRREEELADGHADVRFSGYVAVSAPTPDALEDACGEVEQLAQQCRLQLSRLRGRQAEAFTWTLPLCGGLR